VTGDDGSERGAVAVIVAILLIPLSILLAFSLDLGNAMAQRQALYTSSDSAALAVAGRERTLAQANPSKTCAQLVSDDAALPVGSADKSSTVALAQINANSGFGPTVSASDVTATLSCTGASSGTLQASVYVRKVVATTFGRLAGVSNLNINRTSVADLGPPSTLGAGYRPFGICKLQSDNIIQAAAGVTPPAPYPAQVIALSKVWGGTDCSGSGGSGNWGWISCDGISPSASALGDKLSHGCNTPIVLNTGTTPPSVTLTGAPGNKASSTPVHDGMSAVMDKVIQLPVYDTYSGTGDNITYNVIGFISLEICGYDVTVTGACYDSTKPMGSNEIQIRYAGYDTVGALAKDGVIGETSTDTSGTYVIKLVS
jgi:Flp pilus assembly protein TadG